MNILLRLVLLAAGLAAIFVAADQPDATRLLVASAASGVALAATFAVHRGSQRPWSDAIAWAAASTFLVMVGAPPVHLAGILPAAAGLAATLAALHVPTRDAPRRRAALLNWTLVSAVAALVAWGPLIMARTDAVAVLDPLTSAGMAMRLVGAAVAVWVLVGVFSLRGRFRKAHHEGAGGV